MADVEELHNVKATPIHVEVDVPGLEVRRQEAPHPHLRVHPLDLAPHGIAHTLAVDARAHEENLEVSPVALDLDDGAADLLAVEHDAIGFAFAQTSLDRAPGHDLVPVLKVVVAPSELLKRTVVEGLLVVMKSMNLC